MTRIVDRRDGIRFAEEFPEDATNVPTFLLVHGLGGSMEQWTEVQRQLGTTARTIALDVPGFGQQRVRGAKFDLEAICETIARFCVAAELHDVCLVSHSIGCVVAGKLAARLPDTFPRVVLVSGALFRAAAIAQRPLRGLRTPALGLAVAMQFLSGSVPLSSWLRRLIVRRPVIRQLTLWPFVAHPRRLDPKVLADGLVGAGSPVVLQVLLHAAAIDFVNAVSSIPQPVELIWGAEDRLTGEPDVLRLRAEVKLRSEHVIADCAHWPLIEEPAQLVSLLTDQGNS